MNAAVENFGRSNKYVFSQVQLCFKSASVTGV